ncbi:MAG: hypothetical protein R3D30_10960 [Hyphomicrobiales bacterium]
MRIAVGFFTNIATPEVLSNYRKLKDDLSGIAQTMIVAEAGTPVPQALHGETHFFDFQELASRSRTMGSKVVPGNCHLTMLAFLVRGPSSNTTGTLSTTSFSQAHGAHCLRLGATMTAIWWRPI